MNEPEISPPSEYTPPPRATSGIGNLSSGSATARSGTDRLFSAGLIALAAMLVYYAFSAKVDDPIHLYLGLMIIVGATVPALLWARRKDQRFPVFEVMMLTCVNTYAVPLLSGHRDLRAYPPETITKAAFCIVLYEVVAIAAFSMAHARPKRTPGWTQEIITGDIVGYLGYAMLITTAYTVIVTFTDWIPFELNGPIRAVCFGVGIISTFLQSRMWGLGTLPYSRRSAFVIQLSLQVFFGWAALFLIGGISILVLALLGYVSGCKKLPMLPIVIVLPIIAVLHNGKGPMRTKYWEGHAPMPSLMEVPQFYGEWIELGLARSTDPDMPEDKNNGSKLLERTSLFHVLCLVVDNTPSRQPFLNGETYSYVPAQFVPSLFWQNKPPAHVATNRLSIYYGLQDEDATTRTTIAFGMPSEAYANFGYLGVALLAAVIGFSLRTLGDWSAHSPILSYPGLLLVVLMAWSFQSELTMAAWLGSFYQACMAVLGVPFVLRNFFGG